MDKLYSFRRLSAVDLAQNINSVNASGAYLVMISDIIRQPLHRYYI